MTTRLSVLPMNPCPGVSRSGFMTSMELPKPNANVDRPRRANASQRSGRTCCSAALSLSTPSRDDRDNLNGQVRQPVIGASLLLDQENMVSQEATHIRVV